MTITPAVIVHVAAGSLGILSGTIALAVRKGDGAHRVFGTVFFLAMLTMATMATYLAIVIPGQGRNVGGGILTIYLVATAWMTVRRKEGSIGLFERGALLAALGIIAVLLSLGAKAAMDPTGQFEGFPAAGYFISAAFTVFAAALDLKVIVRGGISGVARIARHLWRMCFALFFATGSFFIGQQKVMPAFIQGSPVLFVLGLAPLAVMVFWLVRVRVTNEFKPAPAP